MRETPPLHSLPVRLLHWVNALAVFIMILSGWRIYNAAPLWGFEFPAGFTLGGWLAGALAWHFAAMWLLAANLLASLLHGFFSGHFRRRFLPLSATAALRELCAIGAGGETGGAPHEPGRYGAAQRLAYVFSFLAIVAAILSGLALWKPVQLQELAALMGGYEGARRLHFAAMTALVIFIVAHVTLAFRATKALRAMVTGEAGS